MDVEMLSKRKLLHSLRELLKSWNSEEVLYIFKHRSSHHPDGTRQDVKDSCVAGMASGKSILKEIRLRLTTLCGVVDTAHSLSQDWAVTWNLVWNASVSVAYVIPISYTVYIIHTLDQVLQIGFYVSLTCGWLVCTLNWRRAINYYY